LGDVLSVRAKKVTIRIECPEGVRPLSIIGREGRITGQRAELYLNQLYGGQEKYALLELEVTGKTHNESLEVALADARFDDALTGRSETVKGVAGVKFSHDRAEVEKSTNASVTTAHEITLSGLSQEKAILLADKKRIGEAIDELNRSASRLRSLGNKNSDSSLLRKADEMNQGAKDIEQRGWGQQQRKELRTDSYQNFNQQRAR
jgi:Ca-activated chloride channel homolog